MPGRPVALHSHGGSLPTLGSISYLAREKATITVDREKRSEARAMLGAASASAAIDIARSQLIWRHRLRNDPTACLRTPPAAEKAALALIPPEWGDLADDADWDLEWPRGPVSGPAPRRGEIWLADLNQRRPVVVPTRDPMARVLQSVIVGPVTSAIRGPSTEVELSDAAGVRRASAVNLDNLPLVSRARLVRRVARVLPHTLRAIGAAGPEAIGCPASRAKLG